MFLFSLFYSQPHHYLNELQILVVCHLTFRKLKMIVKINQYGAPKHEFNKIHSIDTFIYQAVVLSKNKIKWKIRCLINFLRS